MAVQRYEISLEKYTRNFISPSSHVKKIISPKAWNGAIFICNHSNSDLFTCEDNMLPSHMKISCFHVKAHLVFHWCLYNKRISQL